MVMSSILSYREEVSVDRRRAMFSLLHRRLYLLALATLLLAGCNDPGRPNGSAACTGGVAVSVGEGTQPEISWTPRCGVVLLEVVEIGSEASPGPRWAVLAFARTLLEPPIRYGSDPGGAIDIIALPPAPLESAHTYRVAVFRRGVALENVEIGSATFTP
jgi:hypothetical protein